MITTADCDAEGMNAGGVPELAAKSALRSTNPHGMVDVDFGSRISARAGLGPPLAAKDPRNTLRSSLDVAKRRRAAVCRCQPCDMVTHFLACYEDYSVPVFRSIPRSSFCLWLLISSALGCSDPASSPGEPSEPSARIPTPGCRAPAGVSDSPRTIGETVTLINALPKPLSLGCFLESLARPLQINATNSLFSAQPAQGSRSPRIFVFQDPNVMSIVPAGDGAALLEFGEQRPEFRSLKAEIVFPVSAKLEPSAPFDKLLFNSQLTSCAGCHAGELQESEISGVRSFVSLALRPRPRDQVSAQSLIHELAICDRVLEPERCAILDGLLGWGQVTDRDFPVEMAVFGG